MCDGTAHRISMCITLLLQEADDEPWSRSKLAAHVAALAVSLAVLAAGAVAASRFTSAYWVQVRPHDWLISSRCLYPRLAA